MHLHQELIGLGRIWWKFLPSLLLKKYLHGKKSFAITAAAVLLLTVSVCLSTTSFNGQ